MDIIEIFKAIILGVVEGITEWLPVSSTGHMILVDEFLQWTCARPPRAANRSQYELGISTGRAGQGR